MSQPSTFRDRFGPVGAAYAGFRPRYPAALFRALAEHAPARRLAWDCATGNGQAALGLAEHFARVVATDASSAQLRAAFAHPRIEYRHAPAEASGLPAASVDLITVAQALHWLDRTAFYGEARRVLAPRGVLAGWCYGLVQIAPDIDAHIRTFYTETVGAYWPPERALVDSGYRTIDFPFPELTVPPLAMEAQLTLDEFAGYIGTWSAVLRYRAATGSDPVGGLLERVRGPWGPPGARQLARWELAVRAGRVAP